MATEFNIYDQLSGVIVPANGWSDVTVHDTSTAQTLASEVRAGDVTTENSSILGSPQLNSNLKLDATGRITIPQQLATVRGGSASLDQDAMRIVWKDPSGTWRGHHDHNVISDIDIDNKIYYGPVPGISSGREYNVRNTCMLSDGDDGCIILVGLLDQVNMQHYIPETSDLSTIRIIAEKGNAASERGTEDRSGIGSTLPVTGYVDANGTLTVFHFVVNQASTDTGIRNDTYSLWVTRCDGSYRSQRYPASGFRTVGNWAIPFDIGLVANSVITSLTCSADESGNVLLFINIVPNKTATFPINTLYQLASNNGGLTFSLIDNATTATGGGGVPVISTAYTNAIDTIYYKGSFLVLKARYNYGTSRTEISTFKLASPYLSIFDLSETIIDDDLGGRIDNIAAYNHTDGRAFCLVSVSNISGVSSGETYLLKTDDAGATWGEFRTGFGRDFRSFQMSACEIGGRAVILTGALNNSPGLTTDEENMLIIKAGGWESITHPRILLTHPYEVRSYGTDRTSSTPINLTSALYLPNTLPTSYVWTWTRTATATFSETITAGQPWLNLIKGTSSELTYLTTLIDCSWNTGILVAGTMEHTSGGYLYVDAQVKNGTIMYSAQIRLTSTALQLVDGNTGIVKGSFAVTSGTTVKWKLAFRRATAQLFVQIADGIWQSVVTSSVFVGSAGPTGDGQVRFGLPSTYSGAAVGRVYFIGAINTCGGGDQTYVPSGGGTAIAYNDDLSVFSTATHVPFGLHGAPVPQSGSGKVTFPSGLRLSSSSGYSQRGEIHNVDVYSKYSLDKTLISSPSIKAKCQVSSSTSTDIIYALESGSADRRGLGDAFAISIMDTDLSSVQIAASGDGSTWTTLGDVSLAQETGLAFTRTGLTSGSLLTTGSSAGSKYYEWDELIGCKILFNDGTVARCVGNSSGRFNAAGKRMQIHVEWNASTPPQTGTFSIFRREVSSVFTNIQTLEQYFKYIRVRITPQRTINWTGSGQDFAHIGSILFGTFIPFSNKYSSTRQISSIPNITESRGRNGISKILKVGKTRKEVAVQWAEGFDSTEASSSSPGSFISLPRAYNVPIGHRGAATILEGIQRAIEDGQLPLVYIPKIEVEESLNDYGDTFQWVLVGVEAGIFGQAVDSVSRDVILGEEETSEVVRLSGLLIKELI
jgi:hypothetical protein